MGSNVRTALVCELYQAYLTDQDSARFAKNVFSRYSISTLERLSVGGQRLARRAAVLAIGLRGTYESNEVLGRALVDDDRGVRNLADQGIRALWCRTGTEQQQRKLGIIVRLNASRRYAAAIRRANSLVTEAPDLAEGWNQRAIAEFSLGQFRESIRDCQRTLELNPYHFGAATGMAQCYMQLSDRQAALEIFRRALALNPGLEGVRAHVVYLERAMRSKE